MTEGRLKVMVPFGLGPDEEARLVESLVARVNRKVSSTEIDLERRVSDLAQKYGLSEPTRIEWSDRQTTRWGSCTPSEGSIRVSNRLASMPGWVLDSVLIHEMAHLEQPNHGPKFKALVGSLRALGAGQGVFDGDERTTGDLTFRDTAAGGVI